MFRLKISPNCTEMSDHAFTNNTLFLKIIQCKRVKHFYYICFFEKNRCVIEAVAKSWRDQNWAGVFKPETERTWVRGELTFPRAAGLPFNRVWVRTHHTCPDPPKTPHQSSSVLTVDTGSTYISLTRNFSRPTFPALARKHSRVFCFVAKKKKPSNHPWDFVTRRVPAWPHGFLPFCKGWLWNLYYLFLFSGHLTNMSDPNLWL